MLDADDKQSLRLVAWKEARGDGLGACNLVMHVCLNRVGRPGFAADLHGVIYGKNQFTSMSVPTDPEFNLDPESLRDRDSASYAVWQGTQYLVDNIEGDDDATKGALFYENPKTVNSGWFERNVAGPDGQGVNGHRLLLRYMHHSFFS